MYLFEAIFCSSLVFSKRVYVSIKLLPSGEEPDISISIVNSKARLHLLMLARYSCIGSLNHSNALNTRNDFIRRHVERVTSRKRGNRFRSRRRSW